MISTQDEDFAIKKDDNNNAPEMNSKMMVDESTGAKTAPSELFPVQNTAVTEAAKVPPVIEEPSRTRTERPLMSSTTMPLLESRTPSGRSSTSFHIAGLPLEQILAQQINRKIQSYPKLCMRRTRDNIKILGIFLQ